MITQWPFRAILCSLYWARYRLW